MTSLPPFLMTSEEGSFAQKTIKERKPQIINTILSQFDFTPEIRATLNQFIQELDHKSICALEENTSDRAFWDQDIEPWLGKTWFELPWYFAETFFYRRLLEITTYFQPGPFMGIDPFGVSKEQELLTALPVFEEIYTNKPQMEQLDAFTYYCYRALWGNRADLSNLGVAETSMGDQAHHIILNHTVDAYQFLKEQNGNIAYFLDNAGKELLFDLALMDHLLSSGLVTSITCYLKNQPFFVSDAMPWDLFMAIKRLSASNYEQTRVFANRIIKWLHRGAITVQTPQFLTSSRMYRQMPKVFYTQLQSYDLVILKGDVNYRRLFGDRHWEPTTSIELAAGYFPTNYLSLRTLKAEIVLGLDPLTLENLQRNAEPDWRINGKRGMITFGRK